MKRPLAITPGEPAGLGPDLTLLLAQRTDVPPFVAIADLALLEERAETLGIAVDLAVYAGDGNTPASGDGRLMVLPVERHADTVCGKLDTTNARYVLETLEQGIDGCLDGRFSGLVTGPVHKGVINEAGIPFTGHTEFLAERTGASQPVMLLAADSLRVALLTTHLPLSQVPDAITAPRVEAVIRVLHEGLRNQFNIPEPRILVCGLNPHAGEDGHLGRTEIDVISPVLEELRAQDFRLTGPVAADTAFTPARLRDIDAVLTMYHDQGLPVIKYAAFGETVNVTLGLPMVRTSVDHGTGLEIAGSGKADASSLAAAATLAEKLSARS